MNFFWLIALVMAAYIGWALFTGQVWIRNGVIADKSGEPRYYWLCIGAALVGEIAIVMQAISPPY